MMKNKCGRLFRGTDSKLVEKGVTERGKRRDNLCQVRTCLQRKDNPMTNDTATSVSSASVGVNEQIGSFLQMMMHGFFEIYTASDP
jgi:hypothetical protein